MLDVGYSDFSVQSIKITGQMMTDSWVATPSSNLVWGQADNTPDTLGAFLQDIERRINKVFPPVFFLTVGRMQDSFILPW